MSDCFFRQKPSKSVLTWCDTLVIGPCGVRSDDAEEPDAGLEADVFGLNAVIVCETPSARINCSRSSMFVRPLAVIVKCGKSVRK